jgi:hypothetical protein
LSKWLWLKKFLFGLYPLAWVVGMLLLDFDKNGEICLFVEIQSAILCIYDRGWGQPLPEKFFKNQKGSLIFFSNFFQNS